MNPDILCDKIRNRVDYVFIDRLNYVTKTINIYNRLGLQKWLDRDFTDNIIKRLKRGFDRKNVKLCVILLYTLTNFF
ncbi:MAG: hypothetical protein COY75_10265 [Nitrospirae bacterium CG_4_10_14_0_8_um_filter_41_23]|nr:MAG: hypothetical protein AUK38_07410 [Nitrospirae bacterium CG2_30_41_42]PIQ94711.1 MAG: hypothetical protein COV68_03030 [Nitrospirae bacterium CG11_big_fil_rev_8_21_14_0_20_41_14]PIV44761.1 MAG: hypothetical protein COS27_00430 [Nitrospirae bacterium CG02_land_8_20_14_3_00_41_53]PIW87379.1 MAG: hypothetical protein COZ94_05570 [Nitrospirae bacterium CG_4_8_14_3_um_filter_41_47]PIY85998.1 MAG: hypothetical protein COY75_10265 [Nitrospirae bacterium CG_4_10_14_0_8_um_filter_41_23]PJA79302.